MDAPGPGPAESARAPLPVEDAAELVRRLCVANSNAGVYGLSHPLSRTAIGQAYAFLSDLLVRAGRPVSIDIAGDQVLVGSLAIQMRNPIVARFCGRLNKLHVNNIEIRPLLTEEEVDGFFRVLAMKDADIDAAGGPRGLLQSLKISHISMGEASYVKIGEDERVVSRDAHVVEGTGAAPNASDQDIVHYMLSDALKTARHRDWLVDRIKNHPKQAAEWVAQAIEQSVSGAADAPSRQQMIETLMHNVRLVASVMGASDAPGGQDLRDSLLAMETELRMRSHNVQSDGAAMRFINEVLGVITAFTDPARAEQLAKEFVKDETGLKRTERLLRSFADGQERPEQVLARLRSQLSRHGMTERDIETLAEQTRQNQDDRERLARQATQAELIGCLQGVHLTDGEQTQVAERLAEFVDGKLKQREETFQKERRQLRQDLTVREGLINAMDRGAVTWTAEGRVEWVNAAALKIGLEAGSTIRPEILAQMKARRFPIEVVEPEEVERLGWSMNEYRLLMSIHRIIVDPEGRPVGAALGDTTRYQVRR